MAMVTLQSAAERDAAHRADSGEKKDPRAGMTLLTAEGQQPRAKAAIEITKNALKRIRAAMAKEGVSPEQGGLRVGIQGGGCSGLSYNIRFDSKPRERDRVVVFGGGEEAAVAASNRLNDAYRTLKDPILRSQYLLKLEGVELEEQSKAATDAARATGEQKKQVVPPELLEEVFELNMQLQEMRAAKAMGEEEPELRRDLMTAKDAFDAKMTETQ